MVKALHRKNILKLTNTFLNMSISDLAQRVNLPSAVEAEEHLMAMVFFNTYIHIYYFYEK